MVWIYLVLLYGILKGVREILKKKALGRNTVMEVLFLYTLLSFVILLPTAPKAGGLSLPQYGLIAIKSFVIFLAWLCSFHALSTMPVSLYGVLDLSRVIFSTLLGIIFLHESMPLPRIIGFVLVCVGLYALRGLKNREKKAEEEAEKATEEPASNGTAPEASEPLNSPADRASATATDGVASETETREQRFWNRITKNPTLVVILAFLSSLFNGISGTMDKVLMQDMTETQLQFFYMLFLVLFYLVYIILTGTKIRVKGMLTNKYVWLLSVAFLVADRALFIACSYPECQVTVMTLLKQAGCVVTIVGGKIFFNEKQIKYKLCCAAVIVAGIVVAVLPFG
ncbi:MAG: DMT family transporter [Lachnospiraceae bacterium]|nr:DMT family transporter [Lachnospiraceae bacterium]